METIFDCRFLEYQTDNLFQTFSADSHESELYTNNPYIMNAHRCVCRFHGENAELEKMSEEEWEAVMKFDFDDDGKSHILT